MKKITFTSILSVIACVLLAVTISSCCCNTKSSDEKLLRHVVMFGFNENATQAEIKTVVEQFAGLQKDITEIYSFEWGTDNSPEGLQQGLTHCFFLSFKSEKDRDAYIVHPVHQKFGAFVGKYVSKVTVVDYWAKTKP